MTKLLPLILLLCCLVGCVNAQDTIPWMYSKSKYDTTWYYIREKVPEDTVRCLLLMSDTTHQKYSGANRLRKVDGHALNFQVSTEKQIHLLFWDYGYVVKSIYGIRFLNYTKQPKGKNVVVWQHIELEQNRKPF